MTAPKDDEKKDDRPVKAATTVVKKMRITTRVEVVSGDEREISDKIEHIVVKDEP